MKQIHGCADVRKVAVGMGDTQDIQVVDAGAFVRIALTATSYPAELTPEEARFIAAQLLHAADRASRLINAQPMTAPARAADELFDEGGER